MFAAVGYAAAMGAFRRHPRVMGEACKALENLCRNQDETSERCRRETSHAGVLRLLLQEMHGKLAPLVPYNLVHELYNADPSILDSGRNGEGALTIEQLKLLQVWYAKIVRNPDKGHK